MKRTPLLFAALIPFAATAGQGMSSEKVDQQALRDDLQVTRLLGADIQSGDGRNIGTVEDVILGRDGRIASLIVQREGDASRVMDSAESSGERAWEATERAAERGADAVERGWENVAGEESVDAEVNAAADANAEGDAERMDVVETNASNPDQEPGQAMDTNVDPDRADTNEMGDAFAKLNWSDVSFDAEQETLRLNGDENMLQSVQYDQSGELQLEGEVRASKLVGLAVNLADEESFGEVEDVMIDPKDGKASAIVVDSMEFFDKERYALPVNLEAIDTQQEALTLQQTQQDLQDMGEFNMENAAAADEM